jgi:hypothetical protein
MEKELRVVLPPQGSLLREYLKAAFYYVNPFSSITPIEEGFILRSNNIRKSVASAVGLAKQMIVEENKQRRKRDRGEIRFPLSGNDSKNTVQKVMQYFSLGKKDSLEKLFDRYEKYLVSKCSEDELQDSFAVFDNGYPNDARLTCKVAAYSIFKPEHYERSRSLGYLKSEYDLYLGIHSTILGMVGFLLSKIGAVEIKKDEYVSVLITPEDISKRIEVLEKRGHIERMKRMRGARIPGVDPPEALALWLATVWRNNDVMDRQSEINVSLINEPSMKRKTSSVFGQMSFNLTSFMTLADKIELQAPYALKRYETMLRQALRYDSDKKEFLMIVVKKIFQVVDHATSPEELVYIASREALKLESSSNSEDKKFYQNVANVAVSIQRAIERV